MGIFWHCNRLIRDFEDFMKITERIENDLKRKIDSGEDYPEIITLNTLSEFYEVSLTPVRQAVDQLIQQEYILKHSNGRLEINQHKVGLNQLTEEELESEPSTKDLLLKDIIQYSLKKNDIFLREEACAEKYSVGRTVVRGILNSFATRGIITHIPRRGWQVYSYSYEDMCSYLEIREMMELKALTLSKGKISHIQLEKYIQENSLANNGEQKLNDDLHDYFIERSGNRYIKDFFEKQGLYWKALFNFAAPKTSSVKVMADEHREILEAILKDDWNQARKILTQHIRSQEAIISHLVDLLVHERYDGHR